MVKWVSPFGGYCFAKVIGSANVRFESRITNDVACLMGGTLLQKIRACHRALLAFHRNECVERTNGTIVRPEVDQVQHRLAFRALWRWPDRRPWATWKKISVPWDEGPMLAKRRVSGSAWSLVRVVHKIGEERIRALGTEMD